jgi:glycosyltransferase involved in cell wall biosynthesis
LRRELGIEGELVVTMVSRLVRTKGVAEYCAAAAAIRRERPDCTFLLVGPVTSEGWQAVPQSEVERNPNVRWLGPRTDVPALLAISDVFALPTFYREGIPRALLEAGAMGLPLITTDMPGCRDVVRDGWNGILVRPRNVRSLTLGLLALLDAEPDALRQMGANSRSQVEQHFTLDLVADAYAEIYRRALDRAGSRAALLAPA